MTKVYVLMQRSMDDDDCFDVVDVHQTLDGATKAKEELEQDEFNMEIYDDVENVFRIDTYQPTM